MMKKAHIPKHKLPLTALVQSAAEMQTLFVSIQNCFTNSSFCDVTLYHSITKKTIRQDQIVFTPVSNRSGTVEAAKENSRIASI